MHLEILLEERSMENVIREILPRLIPEEKALTWQTHPYQGKPDLIKKLPKLLTGYSNWLPKVYGADFHILIVIDQDREDCLQLKSRLQLMCQQSRLSEHTSVRIAVCMLEAWFLGDARALETAFPRLTRNKIGTKAIYRQPDQRPNPADDLDEEFRRSGIEEGYLKGAHSRLISKYMSLKPTENRSHSFNALLQKLEVILG